MDVSVLIGLFGGFVIVLLTMIIEGGHPLSFLNIGALLLILGGSCAVAILSYSLKEFLMLPAYIARVLFPANLDLADLIRFFVSTAEKARREGLLSLEDEIAGYEDEAIRVGIEMVVDGTDPEAVRNMLEDRAESEREHDETAAGLFETLGGFSPTLGIIGTVMGLVHVLESLGGAGGMEALGKGIAVAFIATFYGIAFANLIWLPLSNKTKYLNHKLEVRRRMVILGILSIQAGDNMRVVRERLAALIPDPAVRAQARATDGEGA